MTVHTAFNSSSAPDETNKFQIKISIPRRVFKRSYSWSEWDDWSSSSGNDWSPWADDVWKFRSTRPPWHTDYEKEDGEKKEGVHVGVIVLCVLGAFFIITFFTIILCRKSRRCDCGAESQESASNQRTEYLAAPDSQEMYSECPRHDSTPVSDLNASTTLHGISTNSGDTNSSSHNGPDQAHGDFTPTITSLIEDYMATRGHHTPTDGSRESLTVISHQRPATPVANSTTPLASSSSNEEDTCSTSDDYPDAISTPLITSSRDEYLATTEQPLTTDVSSESPAVSGDQRSSVSGSNSQTSMASSTSNGENSMLSRDGSDVTNTGPTPTITSLIDEYLATRSRDYSESTDVRPVSPTVPGHQRSTISTANSPALIEISRNNEETSISSSNIPDVSEPTITSLIDEYLTTRDQSTSIDQSRLSSSALGQQRLTASAPTMPTPLTSPTSSGDTNLASNTGPQGAIYTNHSPTITSLIDEYLATREHPVPHVPSEQGHEHSTVQGDQTTWSEPPQYSEVISGMPLPSTISSSTATVDETADDTYITAPPPSYESLFGDRES